MHHGARFSAQLLAYERIKITTELDFFSMQSHDFLTPVWCKQLVKAKKFTDCDTKNIIDSQSTNNSKMLIRTVQCNSDIYKNSFFRLHYITLH